MTRLKILFASPEAVPFVKTGGLADVAGMLPKVIGAAGHDVKVALPRYGTIPAELLTGMTAHLTLDITSSTPNQTATIKNLSDSEAPVEYLLFENDDLFDRVSLYVDPDTGKDYTDNHVRFAFFCRAILEYLKASDWRPDIIHVNDWQTALVPAYLKTIYDGDLFFTGVRTVYTIHNLAYQGIFKAETFPDLGVPAAHFYPTGPFEFYGQVNFMKAAIHYADIINTVSKRYAEEIQSSPEYGAGLEGVLRSRSDDVYGIVNGVDYTQWSPAKDKLIPYRYGISNLSGKRENKVELVNRLGLPVRDHAPLIGMITRLADQKGLDLVEAAADEIFKLDVQMIVLGTGEKKYHDFLRQLESRYPDKVRALLMYDNEMAHWIEAGADVFLMPSRYEPCGLNQLYSLKYGTLPIVRATGGLADTIMDIDSETGIGTGFVFTDYDPKQMLTAIERAVALFGKKRVWRKVMKQAMKQDFSWENSARQYLDLYQKALSK